MHYHFYSNGTQQLKCHIKTSTIPNRFLSLHKFVNIFQSIQIAHNKKGTIFVVILLCGQAIKTLQSYLFSWFLILVRVCVFFKFIFKYFLALKRTDYRTILGLFINWIFCWLFMRLGVRCQSLSNVVVLVFHRTHSYNVRVSFTPHAFTILQLYVCVYLYLL